MGMNTAARYAVVGNPISQSKSPQIHAMFAAETGAKLVYEKLLASEEGFTELVKNFFLKGGSGLNITVPFKQAAWAMCEQLSPAADRARAVNTLYLRDGELTGANTDGIGLVRDLRDNHGIELSDQRILLLGAGGAVRGVLPALVDETPAAIAVWNRTRERAAALVEEFGDKRVVVIDDLPDRKFDLIINGTSGSMQGRLPEVDAAWLAAGACCYDMVYADETTVFVDWARQAGAAVATDGLGMLVEQAAESFRIWHGVAPDTGPVIKHLRAE